MTTLFFCFLYDSHIFPTFLCRYFKCLYVCTCVPLGMCLCAHLPIYYSSFSLQERGTRVYKVEALVMTLDCEFLIPIGQVS